MNAASDSTRAPGQEEMRRAAALLARVQDNIGRVFVGKQDQVRSLLLAVAAGLHALIEDYPGVGKTTLARSLAASLDLDFGRIQFTPDLLPGDITGMNVWDPQRREFLYKPGAIMHQLVLADEINRASPRTQSSLLEAMQEGSVTVDGRSFPLPEPFFVVATQNPAHFLGAFPLPEGELDRFGVSLSLGYPLESEETAILSRFRDADPLQELTPVATAAEMLSLQASIRAVHVAAEVKRFVVRLANATRSHRLFRLGMSPRASQHLMRAAQAAALAAARDFVIPEDVLQCAPDVLAHRLVLSTESRMENLGEREAVRRVLRETRIPDGLDRESLRANHERGQADREEAAGARREG